MKNAKKLFIAVIFSFAILALTGCQNNNIQEKPQNQNAPEEKVSDNSNDIKYKQERLDALSLVQAYKLQKDFNAGDLKYEVKVGVSLVDVFQIQKDSGYVKPNGRWVVIKDSDRAVVLYRSELFNGSLNIPQWSVINGDIKALNGSAAKYTPELGYDVKIDSTGRSKALQFYLRWEELMTENNWDDSKNQATLDKVAKEFNVSSSEVDSLFSQGETEKNSEAKQQNEKRGDILSDEKLLELLKGQGDLYIQ
ncbi:MAG: hypothetical protein WC608_00115 [Parcubacteria group bacterium]